MTRLRSFLSFMSLVLVAVGLVLPTRDVRVWTTIKPSSALSSSNAVDPIPLANPYARTFLAKFVVPPIGLPTSIFQTFFNAVDSHSFELVSDGRSLEVRTPTTGSVLRVELSSISQRRLQLYNKGRDIRLQTGRGFVIASGQLPVPPKFAHLQTAVFSSEPLVTEYRILHAPLERKASSLKLILFGLAAVILLSFILVDLTRALRRRHLLESRWILPTISFFAVLAVFAVILPPLLDDGWVIQSVEHRSSFLNFPNFRNLYDLRVPLGGIYFEMLRSFVTFPLSLVVARVLPVILISAAFGFTIRRVRPQWNCRTSTTFIFILTALLWSIAWLISVRPEAVIAALLVVTTVALFSEAAPAPHIKSFVGFGVAMGLATHTTGIVLLAPILWRVVADFGEARKSGESIRRVSIRWCGIAAQSASLWVLLVFGNWDLAGFRMTSKNFAATGLAQSTWRDEPQRYVWLFGRNIYDTIARRETVLFILLTFGLWMLRRQREKAGLTDRFNSVLFSAILLLTLTPSKWPWHFGSIGLLAALVFSNEIDALRRPIESGKLDARRAFFIAVGSSIIGAISFASPNTAGGDLARSSATPGWLSSLQVVFSRLGFWLAICCVIFFIIAVKEMGLRSRFLSVRASVGVTVALLAITLIFNFVFHGSDLFVGKNWSVAKQNLDSLTKGSCGAGEVSRIIDPERGGTKLSAQTTGASSNQSNTLNSDWLRADGAMPAILVELQGDFRSNSVVIDVAKDQGGLQILHSGEFKDLGSFPDFARVPIWMNLVYDSPVFIKVRVGGNPSVAKIGDTFAVEPVPLEDFLATHANQVVLDPFLRTYFPCIREASYSRGLIQVPKVIIGSVPLQEFDAVSWFTTDSISVPTSIRINESTYIPARIILR